MDTVSKGFDAGRKGSAEVYSTTKVGGRSQEQEGLGTQGRGLAQASSVQGASMLLCVLDSRDCSAGSRRVMPTSD